MIIIGKFLKTHGVKGLIKIKSFTNSPDDIKSFKELYIDGSQIINLKLIKKIDSFFVCKLNNFNTVDEVKPFVGKYIFIKKEELPNLENNSFYYYELQGLNVMVKKNIVGKIEEINNHGAGDYFEVKIKKSKKIILVPYNKSHVNKVDIKNNFIVLNPEYYKNEF